MRRNCMEASVTIGTDGVTRLEPHPLRAAVLGEVHARPFTPLATPARVLHFAFDTAGARAAADREALVALCRQRGWPVPDPADKHYRIAFEAAVMRWEQHSEFTTYTWEFGPDAAAPFRPAAPALAAVMALVPQPGPVLAAIDLHLLPDTGAARAPENLFQRASLAVAENSDATALYATDFQPDPAGFVRILVLDRGLGPERAGALAQRLIELETYRTLALLGLPKAQQLAPAINRIERRLAEITEEMCASRDFADNHRLLDELTRLAAELEAGATQSLYRFGASRAYDAIVKVRLQTIGEHKAGGLPTWSAFLARRMAPAMRTCVSTEDRQANLSRKLARAVNLLRTRVDVEQERQNQALLRSMNTRTQLQLRMQATVEGLSVAAISYYVVGLFGYLIKGAHESGLVRVEPSYAIAAFVPVAVLLIWAMVRRIRKHHMAGED